MQETNSPSQAPDQPPARPGTLEEIVDALRRLALGALDGGHPMAAAMIAGTADRLELDLLQQRRRRGRLHTPGVLE